MAMIGDAPASRAPAIAASPTPPQPITATESPRETLPVFTAAPRPAITPQPSRPDHRRVGVRIDLRALPFVHKGLLGERADAERRGQLRAVGQRHRLAGIEGVEAVPRPAAAARPAVAAHRSPVQHDEVADLDMGDRASCRLDDACRLMAEQERELVVDAAVTVGQVGVAHPARLNPHDHIVRAGIRDGDVDELDRGTLAAGDDTLNLLWHGKDLSESELQDCFET